MQPKLKKSLLPQLVKLADYRPPDYLIDTLDLKIDLAEEVVTVTAILAGHRNLAKYGVTGSLYLDGQDQELISLILDGRALGPDDYVLGSESLVVPNVGERFELVVVSRNNPSENTALEGLYISDGMYCTQCEAEGFRRITYFPDRPDVMTVYTTTITAEKGRYPKLLSNGNLIDEGDLEAGRHYARWHDPFPKPSYLFAMVAGDLACIEDRFTTMSGRQIKLRIFVEHGDEARCDHAMGALKRSMSWDEERFGLEYDLDLFMIVAVSHFNMGAMENKGINIFNSRYVLANRETATDVDFQRIESIIAHEYFHNWTGNRVTCRDWFQLALKEGLTVFRDQEFTADIHSRGVKRVADARVVRSMQFAEDAGPFAHPVRPEEYLEINNFYTVTVYEKGAEVVRVIHTRIGEAAFRRGMILYFDRHDGEAATCEDFVVAMQDASDVDLSDMMLWYSQAGTPELTVSVEHDAHTRRATINVEQTLAGTPGQPTKKPMPIPLGIGLLDQDGQELPLRLYGEAGNKAPTSRVLMLHEAEECFVFEDVETPPIPSLLRDFTAPVKIKVDLSPENLALLMTHDTDAFARWDAGQRYATRLLLDLVSARASGRLLTVAPAFIEAMRATLIDDRQALAFRAEALSLPSENDLAEAMETADPCGIHAARAFMLSALSSKLHHWFLEVYLLASSEQTADDLSTEAMGSRALANVALAFLVAGGSKEALNLALAQVDQHQSMTRVMGGLVALNNTECPERTAALAAFHDRWCDRPMELDKWFRLKSTSTLPNTLGEVRRLLGHPAFDLGNPNRVRALIGSFCTANPVNFHATDGSGYVFLADQILALDLKNPQIAARLVQPLNRWHRYDELRQILMTEQLRRVVEAPGLSKDVFEVASKGLA